MSRSKSKSDPAPNRMSGKTATGPIELFQSLGGTGEWIVQESGINPEHPTGRLLVRTWAYAYFGNAEKRLRKEALPEAGPIDWSRLQRTVWRTGLRMAVRAFGDRVHIYNPVFTANENQEMSAPDAMSWALRQERFEGVQDAANA